MTLKYKQDHWTCEQVKLSENYHHAKFDICHIYSVRENRNIKVSATYRHSSDKPAGQPTTLTLIITYAPNFHESKIHCPSQACLHEKKNKRIQCSIKSHSKWKNGFLSLPSAIPREIAMLKVAYKKKVVNPEPLKLISLHGTTHFLRGVCGISHQNNIKSYAKEFKIPPLSLN